MILALVVSMVDIAARKFQLTTVIHLVHIIDFRRPTPGDGKTVGVNRMKIIWLLGKCVAG